MELNDSLPELKSMTGHVTDDSFAKLTTDLERLGSVVGEYFIDKGDSTVVITRYDIQGSLFDLWYQVRTPQSPEGQDFAFGFGAWGV